MRTVLVDQFYGGYYIPIGLLHKYGANTSLVFAAILLQIKIHNPDDGYIYHKQEVIAELLGISVRTVKTCIAELSKAKIIKIKKKGMPAKNHYCINDEKVIPLLSPSGATIAPQVVQNLPRISISKVKNKKTVSTKQTASGGETIFGEVTNSVLEHWISLHLRKPTIASTRSKALNEIHLYLQHHSAKTIKQAMTVYAELFDMPHNRVTKRSSLWFSVDNFFSPDTRTKELLTKNFPVVAEHGSMFEICRQGAKYAQEQFSTIKVAKNDAMSKLVKKYVTINAGLNKFTPKNLSIMNGLANNLEDFWEEHHDNFMGYAMRNTTRRPGSIVKVYFEFLADSGIFSDRFKFHWINSQQRIDDFYDWLVYQERLKRPRRAKHAALAHTQNRQHNREGHSNGDDRQQRSNGPSKALRIRRPV